MKIKKCSKCKKELLISSFNIRTINGVKKPFSYCKECERKYNNNRYTHTCEECGKEYRSGKKKSTLCKECYNKKVGKMGRKNLIEHNAKQYGENNYFYGVHRYGENNPNYNPNKTDEEREQQRNIIGYDKWRNEVYKRDNYTCQYCNDNKGGNLVAHHKNSYDWCKEERTDINNGVTLCEECHKKFHDIYGYGNNTKEQFEQFLSDKNIK